MSSMTGRRPPSRWTMQDGLCRRRGPATVETEPPTGVGACSPAGAKRSQQTPPLRQPVDGKRTISRTFHFKERRSVAKYEGKLARLTADRKEGGREGASFITYYPPPHHLSRRMGPSPNLLEL